VQRTILSLVLLHVNYKVSYHGFVTKNIYYHAHFLNKSKKNQLSINKSLFITILALISHLLLISMSVIAYQR